MKAKRILPLIVIAQFCCTSLWFASNAVVDNLAPIYDLDHNAIGHLTSAVQFGFIVGTLIFAIFTIADRISPSKVFMVCAILGAVFNLALIVEYSYFSMPLTLRLITGFFLAGIYPVGMKVAADYFKEGLGRSLGFLVGALVLGTAFPHLIRTFTSDLPWKLVIVITSAVAFIGGILIYTLVPDGPHRSKNKAPNFTSWLSIFKIVPFRKAAFGYFGHMWELYAFWAFVPIIISSYRGSIGIDLNIPLWSFMIIGLGSISCAIGGVLTKKFSPKSLATFFLLSSGVCCLLSPFFFLYANSMAFITFLIFWGLVVIADSPLFSTLVATHAPAEQKATALTITNCIGFAITIVSIQLLTWLSKELPISYLMALLALGPLFGLYFMHSNRYQSAS